MFKFKKRDIELLLKLPPPPTPILVFLILLTQIIIHMQPWFYQLFCVIKVCMFFKAGTNLDEIQIKRNGWYKVPQLEKIGLHAIC